MDVGQSLSDYIEENLNKDVKKYFENALDAEVHFTKEGKGHLIKTLITVNEGVKGGISIKSDGEAGDAYGSFNEALQRAAKQLRRYKRRIKNYHKGRGIKEAQPDYEALSAQKYIIPPTNLDAFADMEEPQDEQNPEIITQKATNIEKLSVNEAIMKMDLANLPALVFKNAENDQINVIYYRKDGNISWIQT